MFSSPEFAVIGAAIAVICIVVAAAVTNYTNVIRETKNFMFIKKQMGIITAHLQTAMEISFRKKPNRDDIETLRKLCDSLNAMDYSSYSDFLVNELNVAKITVLAFAETVLEKKSPREDPYPSE